MTESGQNRAWLLRPATSGFRTFPACRFSEPRLALVRPSVSGGTVKGRRLRRSPACRRLALDRRGASDRTNCEEARPRRTCWFWVSAEHTPISRRTGAAAPAPASLRPPKFCSIAATYRGELQNSGPCASAGQRTPASRRRADPARDGRIIRSRASAQAARCARRSARRSRRL